MEFDFEALPPKDRYRLLCSFVAPRPIALVTTNSESGMPNAAPMSFFNVFSQDPPIVILGIQARPDGTEKETMRNIRRSNEFVVNLCDMAIAQQMVDCGISFPDDVDEVALTGLSHAPSLKIGPERVAEAPASMECRVSQIIDYPHRAIVLGEVVQMHVRDTCLDAAGRYVRPEAYQPVARLHADNYIVSDRQFELTATDSLTAATGS
ncbi:flavin reductase family protein [Leisingera methylohalidivorans]|uniref:Flavin reductase n=1 Tax=Leisingera methylohalidivorans DSM 14336 TaxID=999552 RepID=V9VXR0_9RHOB|nr:flavin reductase family protein [Leisingera methylohalidivorans]AHD03526.1 flavin reductase [Leisingera methylohalidivorans DSM 14336]